MKAIFFDKHGSTDVLQYGDLPTPEPGRGEVLVRLRVAALNRLDLWVRNGWKGIKIAYPHIPGADGAGEIVALGADVQGWQVGQRVVLNANIGCGRCEFCLSGFDNQCRNWQVLGETRSGTYAEYVVVPVENLFALPDTCDFRTAAAASLVFLTSWHSLITRGNLRPGESVLIVGASGGVNTASIQVARFAGATVYVVGSDSTKLALAESLGAHILIDRSRDPDWSKVVYQLTDKRGVDVVVDNVGSTFPMSLRALRKGGRLLTVGNTGGPLIEIDNRFVFARHLSIVGSTMGTKKDFAQVMQLIVERKLRPALGSRYPLHQAVQAQRELEAGQQLGKITLDIE